MLIWKKLKNKRLYISAYVSVPILDLESQEEKTTGKKATASKKAPEAPVNRNARDLGCVKLVIRRNRMTRRNRTYDKKISKWQEFDK